MSKGYWILAVILLLIFPPVGIIMIIVGFSSSSETPQSNKAKRMSQNNIMLAVYDIEHAAKFVKEHQRILGYSQITLWEYGKKEGYTVEFYGKNNLNKPSIEKLLMDHLVGRWKITEDTESEDLHIYKTSKSSEIGSWDHFNRTVWDEVQRRNPEWKIVKVYSHKYVLDLSV